MTAPSSDLRAWLVQLADTHTAATKGPWHVMRSTDDRRAAEQLRRATGRPS